MKRATAPFVISIIVTFFAAYYINGRIVLGAQIGGEGINKRDTILSRADPDTFYWKMYPSSLLIASGIGFIVFIVGFLVSPKTVVKNEEQTGNRNRYVDPSVAVLQPVDRAIDKTLTMNYDKVKLGTITLGQSSLTDVIHIWGQPINTEKRGLYNYLGYDKGLTFITHKDYGQIIIGMGINYELESTICTDTSDEEAEIEPIEGNEDTIELPEPSPPPLPLIFDRPIALRKFDSYFPIMLGNIPKQGGTSHGYSSFIYKVEEEFGGTQTLKFFARNEVVNVVNPSLTQVDIIEIIHIDQRLSLEAKREILRLHTNQSLQIINTNEIIIDENEIIE